MWYWGILWLPPPNTCELPNEKVDTTSCATATWHVLTQHIYSSVKFHDKWLVPLKAKPPTKVYKTVIRVSGEESEADALS